MKNILIHSITFFLALFLTQNDSLAAKVEPKGNHKYIVVQRPGAPKIVLHGSTVAKSGYVWLNGYYTWNKRSQSYEWHRGRYIKQKRGKIWITGQWVRVKGGWAYKPGYWQRVRRI